MTLSRHLKLSVAGLALMFATAAAPAPISDHALSLPDIPASQIATDVTTVFVDGEAFLAAPTFDPMEGIEEFAGNARLRSVPGVVDRFGNPHPAGAVLDLTLVYTSGSDDPYDVRGFDNAVFLSGEPVPSVRYDTRTLECSSRVTDVVYRDDYYAGVSHGLLAGLFWQYPRYRGHRHYGFDYGRFGYGTYAGYDYGRRGYRNRGYRGRGYYGHGGYGYSARRDDRRDRRADRRREDREDRRAEDRRENTVGRALPRDGRRAGRNTSEGRIDRRNDYRDAPRIETGTGVRTPGGGTGRFRNARRNDAIGADRPQTRTPRRAERDRSRDTRPRAVRRDRTPDTRRVNDGRRSEPTINVAPPRRSDARPQRAEPRRQPAKRRAERVREPVKQPFTRPSLPAPAPQRAAPKRSVPQRAVPKRAVPTRSAPPRATPKRAAPPRPAPKRAAPKRSVDRATDRAFRSSKGVKKQLDYYLAGTRVDSYVDSRCAKQEEATLFIPFERLEAARFDGLTVILLGQDGTELPIFIPPNYVEGFRQGLELRDPNVVRTY